MKAYTEAYLLNTTLRHNRDITVLIIVSFVSILRDIWTLEGKTYYLKIRRFLSFTKTHLGEQSTRPPKFTCPLLRLWQLPQSQMFGGQLYERGCTLR